LPFEAPSKLILWKRGGGGDQIEGLTKREEGGRGGGEKVEESDRPQELRIKRFCRVRRLVIFGPRMELEGFLKFEWMVDQMLAGVEGCE
jgi:hypothetical protein